jgi:hypothetical protein
MKTRMQTIPASGAHRSPWGRLMLSTALLLGLGTAAAQAEHSGEVFPGIGEVFIKTEKAVGMLPKVVVTNAQGRVLMNATVGGTQSDYFKIQQNTDGTLNPTVHYAVLPGPNPTSRAVLAIAAATGGSDCAYEAIVFGSSRGKLSLWTPHTLDTMAEGGVYVGDLGGKRGYGLAVWNFIWGNEAHVDPHRYKVWLYKLNLHSMTFVPTGSRTTRAKFATDTAALRELGLTFPNLTRAIPKLAC